MDNEMWLPVVGSGGCYSVSSEGRIRSHKGVEDLVLKSFASKDGYIHVNICAAGVRNTRAVHHLVLEAFVGPRLPGKEGSHLNGNRGDARLANLRYESHAENCRRRREHGTQTNPPGDRSACVKLKDHQVAEVAALRAKGLLQREIAEHFGVSRTLIWAILNGRKRQVSISGQMV